MLYAAKTARNCVRDITSLKLGIIIEETVLVNCLPNSSSQDWDNCWPLLDARLNNTCANKYHVMFFPVDSDTAMIVDAFCID